MSAQKNSDARKRLLAALFVKAQNRGIEPDELREDIAPAVIGKRLSEASPRELVKLLVKRLCMDQTGMGEKPAEDAKRSYGEYRVEGVLFTGAVKQNLATAGKQRFEDRLVRIPSDRAIRESHHAVRKVMTVAGNPRFDADRSEVGHADEFWANMLAIHAAASPYQKVEYERVTERKMRMAGAW